MKIYYVRAEQRNHNYVNSGWVTENAIEDYKKYLQSGYKKPLVFDVREDTARIDENGTGTIRAFTKEGFKTVRVRG